MKFVVDVPNVTPDDVAHVCQAIFWGLNDDGFTRCSVKTEEEAATPEPPVVPGHDTRPFCDDTELTENGYCYEDHCRDDCTFCGRHLHKEFGAWLDHTGSNTCSESFHPYHIPNREDDTQ